MRSATDIVSISTGRETILIGPRSAFGGQALSSIMRERHSLAHTLDVFISRPNAEELLRPYLKRWGIDSVSIRGSNRHALIDSLARAAASGAIGIAIIPDTTLTFAAASLDEEAGKASVKPIDTDTLPPDLTDRLVIVFSMVPDHMEGETRLAFEEAVKSLGIAAIAGGVCTWIGAHFIPGVNLAVLAFDMFFLSAEVLHAMEKATEVIEDVRKAKSRDELKPAAIGLAAVLAVLIVNGVLSRLLKAKQMTKGVGKNGGNNSSKPSIPKKAAPQKSDKGLRGKQPDDDSSTTNKPKKGFMKKKVGQREPGASDMTDDLAQEIAGAAKARAKGPMTKDGWPDLRGQERGTFRGDPLPVELKPGTKIYRIVDADSNPNGGFWSLKPPPRNEADWRSGSAVLNDWNGDGAYVEHTVGKDGLKGWQGPARAQLSSDGKSALSGGSDQFVVPPGSIDGPLSPKPTPWNR